MKHPYEKFIRIELLTIGLAGLIGIVALVKGYLISVLICLYLITLSLLAEAMIALSTHQRVQGIKQLVRAAIIFILTSYLLLVYSSR